MSDPLLKVNSLKKYFPVDAGFFSKPSGWVKAVDDVDLCIPRGEIMGIVGESGCGKTTLVNTILRLIEPTSGTVQFAGENIYDISSKELKKLRKKIQIVFQDPYWSLNPRLLIKDVVGEPLQVHRDLTPPEILKETQNLLELVGLPRDGVFQYPHEFSGGQRQRIAIARALALKPELVVLDEPTSSIDVLSQAQILELLKDLKQEFQLTYIIISHDLSVVSYMADKIAVMYLGRVVEHGAADKIFNNPVHPYTEALLASIPDMETNKIKELGQIEGNVPSAINPPSGCRFHTRCPEAKQECREKVPELIQIEADHKAACLLLEEKDSE